MSEPSYNTHYHAIEACELKGTPNEQRLPAQLAAFCSTRDIFDGKVEIPRRKSRHYKPMIIQDGRAIFVVCAVFWSTTARSETGRHMANSWVRKHSLKIQLTVPHRGGGGPAAIAKLEQKWCDHIAKLMWPFKQATLQRLYEEQDWSNQYPTLESFMEDDSKAIHHSHLTTPELDYTLIGFEGGLARLTQTKEELQEEVESDSAMATRLNRAYRGGIYDHITFLSSDFCYYPEHAYDPNVLLDFIRAQYSVGGLGDIDAQWKWVREHRREIIKDLVDRIEYARKGQRCKIPPFLNRLRISNFALFSDGLIEIIVEPKDGHPITHPHCRKHPSPSPRHVAGTNDKE